MGSTHNPSVTNYEYPFRGEDVQNPVEMQTVGKTVFNFTFHEFLIVKQLYLLTLSYHLSCTSLFG